IVVPPLVPADVGLPQLGRGARRLVVPTVARHRPERLAVAAVRRPEPIGPLVGARPLPQDAAAIQARRCCVPGAPGGSGRDRLPPQPLAYLAVVLGEGGDGGDGCRRPLPVGCPQCLRVVLLGLDPGGGATRALGGADGPLPRLADTVGFGEVVRHDRRV